MQRFKTTIIAFAFAAICLASVPSEASADGPLRRWLRGLWRPNATACNQPAFGYQQQTTNYTPNAYNLQPGQCMKTCQQTCSRTVVNYQPYTAYRTVSKRVPVTSYKPETNTDPCTGCVVTCMKPCTTYTYQVQRVPYTTYRPVYRQETYKVPVTTITNGCATGACATDTCNTCAPTQGLQNYAPQTQTQTTYESPGVITTNGLSPTPADMTPALGTNPTSSQRPVTDQFNTHFSAGYDSTARSQTAWSDTPAKIEINETAARSPVRKQWSYSPVRLASYQAPVQRQTPAASAPAPRVAPVQWAEATLDARPTAVRRSVAAPARRNGWVEVN